MNIYRHNKCSPSVLEPDTRIAFMGYNSNRQLVGSHTLPTACLYSGSALPMARRSRCCRRVSTSIIHTRLFVASCVSPLNGATYDSTRVHGVKVVVYRTQEHTHTKQKNHELRRDRDLATCCKFFPSMERCASWHPRCGAPTEVATSRHSCRQSRATVSRLRCPCPMNPLPGIDRNPCQKCSDEPTHGHSLHPLQAGSTARYPRHGIVLMVSATAECSTSPVVGKRGMLRKPMKCQLCPGSCSLLSRTYNHNIRDTVFLLLHSFPRYVVMVLHQAASITVIFSPLFSRFFCQD